MVATQFDKFASPRRFLIRPNCSLPWRDVVRFYLGVLLVSFGIAIAFAFKGAWLILPFAGLEMLVLGIALYVVARRATNWQEISINGDRISVIERDSGQEQAQSFQRAWAKVVHERPVHKGSSVTADHSFARAQRRTGPLLERRRETLSGGTAKPGSAFTGISGDDAPS